MATVLYKLLDALLFVVIFLYSDCLREYYLIILRTDPHVTFNNLCFFFFYNRSIIFEEYNRSIICA